MIENEKRAKKLRRSVTKKRTLKSKDLKYTRRREL